MNFIELNKNLTILYTQEKQSYQKRDNEVEMEETSNQTRNKGIQVVEVANGTMNKLKDEKNKQIMNTSTKKRDLMKQNTKKLFQNIIRES